MEVTPVQIQLFITTFVMQLREVIVIPFRMSLMQCLFIGKVLCEDFDIHMLYLCSEIGVQMREEIPGCLTRINGWDKNRMDRFVALITRPLVKPGEEQMEGFTKVMQSSWDTEARLPVA